MGRALGKLLRVRIVGRAVLAIVREIQRGNPAVIVLLAVAVFVVGAAWIFARESRRRAEVEDAFADGSVGDTPFDPPADPSGWGP